MQAVVNKIIPFSSVDGPGNRTAVFLQGCNINCRYCHNPETRALCKECGLCVEKCPEQALKKSADGKIIYHPEKCVQCDTCIHVCPHDSSPRTAVMTPEECYEKVKKQILEKEGKRFLSRITKTARAWLLLYPRTVIR